MEQCANTDKQQINQTHFVFEIWPQLLLERFADTLHAVVKKKKERFSNFFKSYKQKPTHSGFLFPGTIKRLSIQSAVAEAKSNNAFARLNKNCFKTRLWKMPKFW